MDDNEEVHVDVYESYDITDAYEHRLAMNRTEVQRLIGQVILALPTLRKDQVPHDDTCGICLQSYAAILDDDKQSEETMQLEGGQEVKVGGVTKLEGCGHMFCRLDLVEWIKGFHGTCPACRHQFLDIPSASDLEEEGSVDEDYIPEDDDFLDSDGFTDADDWELEPDEMDLDEELNEGGFPEGCELEMHERFVVAAANGGSSGEGSQSERDGENPGLSDSFGSDSMSEGEVLASLSADEGSSSVLDDALIHTADDSGDVSARGHDPVQAK